MIENVTPKQTWDNLSQDKNAMLVDVRTVEEWEHIGYPELSSIGKEVIKISVQNSVGQRNAEFVQQLQSLSLNVDQPLYFICRSGQRSMMAANLAQEAGFKIVLNVQDGFEGPPDLQGRRGTVAGWVADHLPTHFPKD